MCLAQGHNMAEAGLETPTTRSGIRGFTTRPLWSAFSRTVRSRASHITIALYLFANTYKCFLQTISYQGWTTDIERTVNHLFFCKEETIRENKTLWNLITMIWCITHCSCEALFPLFVKCQQRQNAKIMVYYYFDIVTMTLIALLENGFLYDL